MKNNNSKNKMKKKLIAINIFIIGLLIFLYPIISSWLEKYNQTIVINEYTKEIKKISQEEIDKKQELIDKKNIELYSNTLDSTEQSSQYFMDIGDVIGCIEIPKIEVNLPVYQGTTPTVLKAGIGHLERSSLPTSMETSHVVLTGHTGFSSARLFSDLDQMKENDVFYITMLDKKYTYQVDQIKVILPNETDDLNIIQGKNLATLITCTPRLINSHRLLVRGVLKKIEDIIDSDREDNNIQYSENTDTKNKEEKAVQRYIDILLREIEYVDIPMIYGFLISIIIIILLLHTIIFRKQEENAKEKLEKVNDEDLKNDNLSQKDFEDENIDNQDFIEEELKPEDFDNKELEELYNRLLTIENRRKKIANNGSIENAKHKKTEKDEKPKTNYKIKEMAKEKGKTTKAKTKNITKETENSKTNKTKKSISKNNSNKTKDK